MLIPPSFRFSEQIFVELIVKKVRCLFKPLSSPLTRTDHYWRHMREYGRDLVEIDTTDAFMASCRLSTGQRLNYNEQLIDKMTVCND
jgi:hypothetical protein